MNIYKWFGSAALVLIIFSACSSDNGKKQTAEESLPAASEQIITITAEQFTSSHMALGKLSTQNFSGRIHATGMLDVPPEYRAAVSAYYGGTVKNIHLLAGQRVEKGATLFTLENPLYIQMQQDYLTAKSRLNYLKAEYERQKKLLHENVVSQKKYLKAESDYLTILADYNALDKKLRLLNMNPDKLDAQSLSTFARITAPIVGYVTQVNITKGQYLSPNEVAVSLVSTEHMHLELIVFEKDITKIKKGQSIRFRLPDSPSAYYEAEVFLAGQAVQEADRTIHVHGHLKNEAQESDFIPGMYIEAEILVDEVEAPALPSDAVVELDNTHYILVKQSADNGLYTFVRRMVKTGKSNDGYMQILNADELGDAEIVIKGAFNLIQ